MLLCHLCCLLQMSSPDLSGGKNGSPTSIEAGVLNPVRPYVWTEVHALPFYEQLGFQPVPGSDYVEASY